VQVIRDWLRRREISGFATALAEDLARRFPPKSEARTDKGAKNQLHAITERLFGDAARFNRDRQLGVYGKAKLGNAFRWKLRELGYSQTFVEEVTHDLVVRLARKA
jgi:hypothetical protein